MGKAQIKNALPTWTQYTAALIPLWKPKTQQHYFMSQSTERPLFAQWQYRDSVNPWMLVNCGSVNAAHSNEENTFLSILYQFPLSWLWILDNHSAWQLNFHQDCFVLNRQWIYFVWVQSWGSCVDVKENQIGSESFFALALLSLFGLYHLSGSELDGCVTDTKLKDTALSFSQTTITATNVVNRELTKMFYKGVKLARGLWMYQKKEMTIDIWLLPSSCDPWPLTGFSSDRTCKAFPACSCTYLYFNPRGKEQKNGWFG